MSKHIPHKFVFKHSGEPLYKKNALITQKQQHNGPLVSAVKFFFFSLPMCSGNDQIKMHGCAFLCRTCCAQRDLLHPAIRASLCSSIFGFPGCIPVVLWTVWRRGHNHYCVVLWKDCMDIMSENKLDHSHTCIFKRLKYNIGHISLLLTIHSATKASICPTKCHKGAQSATH